MSACKSIALTGASALLLLSACGAIAGSASGTAGVAVDGGGVGDARREAASPDAEIGPACTETCEGTCSAGECVTQLAEGHPVQEAHSIAVDDASVYWLQGPVGGYAPFSLMKVDKGGGTPVTLLATASVGAPTSDLATNAGDLFWAGSCSNAADGGLACPLVSTPVGGGPVVTLASQSGVGESMGRVTADDTNIYWPGWSGGLLRVPQSGGAIVTLVPDVTVSAIAIQGDEVYWTAGGNEVLSVANTGGAVTTFATGMAHALAVDSRNALWLSTPLTTDADLPTLYLVEAPLGGGAQATLASAGPLTVISPLAVTATAAYFTESITDIVKVPQDASATRQTVFRAKSGYGASPLIANGDDVYFAEEPFPGSGSGAIMKLHPSCACPQ